MTGFIFGCNELNNAVKIIQYCIYLKDAFLKLVISPNQEDSSLTCPAQNEHNAKMSHYLQHCYHVFTTCLILCAKDDFIK